jgi:hypothetical protein
MGLLSIADLNQPPEVLDYYIRRAQTLSDIYLRHIALDQNESYTYLVKIFGASERSKGIHASEISKCQRQLVYCIRGEKRQPPEDNADVNMLLRFRLGTALHVVLQNDWMRIAAKSNGTLLFKDEVAINPKMGGIAQLWNIFSSCDGVITLCDQQHNPEVRVGLEIKTCSGDSFEKLRGPQNDHMEQTLVYMATLDLPLMWILYYNKSNSNFTPPHSPWLYKFDQSKWSNDLEIRFAKCTHMAEIGELPERTEGIHCRWCSFARLCDPMTLKARSTMPRLSDGMRPR